MKSGNFMGLIRWAAVAFLLFGLFFSGCAPKESDAVVAEIGTQKVSLGEYEKFYAKNSGGWDMAKSSSLPERERFLDLLTNYRLKLQDAFDQNLQNDPEIVAELNDYRSSLAASFLIDKELEEPGMKRLYDRRKEEIRAQYILINLKADASPEDTAKAYAKALDVIKQTRAGANFDSLVMKYSEDAGSKGNFGDIYYFSGGMLMTELEDAAFALKKGEVSVAPVRTSLGYNILKVTDRQLARGSMKARHTMARFAPPDSAQDTNVVYARIKAMQDSLKRGWDVARLAQKMSEDQGSASGGGDLGWFERRRWIVPFDEAAFKLKAGESSPIFRTQFGYHIVHCDSVKPIPTFDEMRDELKKLYQQYRYNEDYDAYMAALKKSYRFSFDESVFNSFTAGLDSTKTIEDSAWIPNVKSDLKKQALYTVSSKSVTLDSSLVILLKRPDYKTTSLRKSELRSCFDRIGESLLLNEKAIGLESRYPEFGALMKEYEDGIVLFKAEQLKVWNKVSVSDSLLKKYFAANRDSFMTQPKVNYAEIHVATDTLAYVLYDSLTKGADFSKLADVYNDDEELKSKHGIHGPQAANTDGVTQYADTLNIGEISDPFASESGGYSIIKVVAKEPIRQKTFEEAGAEVSNKLQESESKRLEKEWIESLKVKYPVMQHKEHLSKAFNSAPPAK